MSTAAQPTVYDLVPYNSGARAASYVDHLASLGRLLGIPAAAPDACRVLEIACGDGGNLIPMAVSLPGSSFFGVDLAATAIERGQQAIADLGLTNIELAHRDLTTLGDEIGTFDYIVAHGVYSWVPADVRRALLRVVRERMKPNGIAFVSYNAMPGDHIRGVVRQMMRMHTAGITDPQKKLQQARALLGVLSRVPGEAGDVYRPLMQSEIGRALQASDDLLYHDDLAAISQPFFFAEFMAAATAAGLQFACEAVFHSMRVDAMPADIAEQLSALAARDIIAKEQYLDFLTCRGFRQTLLCHRETRIDRDITAERMQQFRFMTEAKEDDEPGERPGAIRFRHPNTSAMQTNHPLAIRALRLLAANAPRSCAFEELAEGANDEDREALADTLFQAFSAGLVEIRLFEPAAAIEVSERPVASAWARHEADRGLVANLYHEAIRLDDESREIVPLLDGTRTLAEAAAQLGLEEPAVRGRVTKLAALGLLVS